MARKCINGSFQLLTKGSENPWLTIETLYVTTKMIYLCIFLPPVAMAKLQWTLVTDKFSSSRYCIACSCANAHPKLAYGLMIMPLPTWFLIAQAGLHCKRLQVSNRCVSQPMEFKINRSEGVVGCSEKPLLISCKSSGKVHFTREFWPKPGIECPSCDLGGHSPGWNEK